MSHKSAKNWRGALLRLVMRDREQAAATAARGDGAAVSGGAVRTSAKAVVAAAAPPMALAAAPSVAPASPAAEVVAAPAATAAAAPVAAPAQPHAIAFMDVSCSGDVRVLLLPSVGAQLARVRDGAAALELSLIHI